MTLDGVADELSQRLIRLFTLDEAGRRAVFGDDDRFQNDPHWRDYPLFYEYFHGDDGAGIGASHQTGWTGLVARQLDIFARLLPSDVLRDGSRAAFPANEQPPADQSSKSVA